MATHDRAVLFIDLLGFGALTEQNDLDFESIRRKQHFLIGGFEDIISGRRNPLTHCFTSFHHKLKWAVELAQLRHPLTAITFSDSAFIATMRLSECVDIAIHLMQSLVRNQVPARAGIAYGTFTTIRFKSDIMGEWGEHSAHFLGTGVVRAAKTEGCGIKGLRILLHPTAAEIIKDVRKAADHGAEIKCMRCPADELANTAEVEWEIDYWNFKPTAEAEAWRGFQDMWTAAPPSEHIHYERTAMAIDRMRTAQGKRSLSNLRRRTLPR